MSYKQGLLTGIFHYPSKEQVSPDINPDPQYHFYPLGHQDTYHTPQEFHLHHDHKLEHPEDKLNTSLTGQFSHFSRAEDFYILMNRLHFFSFLDHHHIPLKVRILFVHLHILRTCFTCLSLIDYPISADFWTIFAIFWTGFTCLTRVYFSISARFFADWYILRTGFTGFSWIYFSVSTKFLANGDILRTIFTVFTWFCFSISTN